MGIMDTERQSEIWEAIGMGERTSAAKGIDSLREEWWYDPSVQRRIDRAMESFSEYATVRARHVALSHASSDEYDDVAVRGADLVRTAAHNAAIRAAGDLNELCRLAGMEPVAPVPPRGIDPLASKSHRGFVARFVAEALELSPEEVAALDL